MATISLFLVFLNVSFRSRTPSEAGGRVGTDSVANDGRMKRKTASTDCGLSRAQYEIPRSAKNEQSTGVAREIKPWARDNRRPVSDARAS